MKQNLLNLALAAIVLTVVSVFAPDQIAQATTLDYGLGASVLFGLNTQMTPGQTRVVDPVLSNIAHGYRNPDVSRVGRELFPRVIIPARGAKIIEFGKESFRLYSTRRAPGASTKRIQYGYDAGPVALTQEALEGLVPWELMQEASQVPGVDLARGSVELVQDVFDRAEEYEQIQIAIDANNYDVNHREALAGGDQWDDYANSDPAKKIRTYREAVRASTGRYPNKLALSPNVFNALAEHAKILDRFKYTSAESITTKMLAAYFDIPQVVVGNDVYLPDNAADDADFTDMLSNVAILAFVPSQGRFEVPSYGYTYHLAGHPMVEQPYQDRNRKSWVYPQTYERQVVQTGKGAGFLVQNVLAAP